MTSLLREIVQALCREFAINDLGALHFFLGVQVCRDATGFSLSQAQYTEDILERAGMANFNSSRRQAEVVCLTANQQLTERSIRVSQVHCNI